MQSGMKVFIRTVTSYFVGVVVADGGDKPKFVTLQECSWVASTGRFGECMRTGQFSEVEAYLPETFVNVNLDSVVDWHEWPHELPGEALPSETTD